MGLVDARRTRFLHTAHATNADAPAGTAGLVPVGDGTAAGGVGTGTRWLGEETVRDTAGAGTTGIGA